MTGVGRVQLTAGDELLLGVIALVLVTVSYVPLYLAVGKTREADLSQVQRDLLSKEFVQFIHERTAQLERIEERTLGNRHIASPAVAEAKIRRVKKVLSDRAQWDGKEGEILSPAARQASLDISSVERKLRPSVASRFFGPEQWLMYGLMTWSLLLMWRQRSRVLEHAGAAAVSRADLHVEIEAGLSMVRFCIWAIPTLGFIGTVRGMGQALASADSSERIPDVVGYLGVAFDTTLVGLLLSVVLMLVKTRFEKFQDTAVAHFARP